MKRSSDIIVLNGRRYDAHSGQPLDGGKAPQPVHAKQHATIHTSYHSKPSAHHKAVDRGPAKHVAAHAPEHSRTLMRQAVHKPAQDRGRRIKAQGHLGASAERQASKILARQSARQPNTARLQHPSTKRPKGRLISHFSPELFAVDGHTPAIVYGALPVKDTAHNSEGRAPAPAAKRREAWTTDELLEYAVHHAADTGQPTHRRRKTLIRRAHAHQR